MIEQFNQLAENVKNWNPQSQHEMNFKNSLLVLANASKDEKVLKLLADGLRLRFLNLFSKVPQRVRYTVEEQLENAMRPDLSYFLQLNDLTEGELELAYQYLNFFWMGAHNVMEIRKSLTSLDTKIKPLEEKKKELDKTFILMIQRIVELNGGLNTLVASIDSNSGLLKDFSGGIN